MKKTLQECKEIVAKEYTYSCWADIKNKYRKDPFQVSDLIAFCDLANKMYYEQSEKESYDPNKLDCPYDFTSRCTMGDCDCKPKTINPPQK